MRISAKHKKKPVERTSARDKNWWNHLSRCWLVQKCCRWHKNHHKGATTSPNTLTDWLLFLGCKSNFETCSASRFSLYFVFLCVESLEWSHLSSSFLQNSRELITKWVLPRKPVVCLHYVIKNVFRLYTFYGKTFCLFLPCSSSSTSSSGCWQRPPRVRQRRWSRVMRVWATTDITSAGRRELWGA